MVIVYSVRLLTEIQSILLLINFQLIFKSYMDSNFMTNNSLTIWIYADEGTSELSVKSALVTMKNKLPIGLANSVQTISSQDIINNKLSGLNGIGILVMPGGADLPYCQKLNGLGNAIIREFISKGNIYIGICAGGYYGARDIEFIGRSYENGNSEKYEINGPRELAFFSGTAIGSIAKLTNGRLYDETATSKALVTLDYENAEQDKVYYHGGAYFVGDKDVEFKVVATYSDGKNAVVSGNFGKGKYLLSGVHFELCADVYESYAVESANESDMEKEQTLLSAVSHKDYGALVYQEISGMIEASYKSA